MEIAPSCLYVLTHWILTNPYKVGTINTHLSQMTKLRHTEVKLSAQSEHKSSSLHPHRASVEEGHIEGSSWQEDPDMERIAEAVRIGERVISSEGTLKHPALSAVLILRDNGPLFQLVVSCLPVWLHSLNNSAPLPTKCYLFLRLKQPDLQAWHLLSN